MSQLEADRADPLVTHAMLRRLPGVVSVRVSIWETGADAPRRGILVSFDDDTTMWYRSSSVAYRRLGGFS